MYTGNEFTLEDGKIVRLKVGDKRRWEQGLSLTINQLLEVNMGIQKQIDSLDERLQRLERQGK